MTLGAGLHLSPCLRQGLWMFAAEYVGLAGSQASGESLVSAFHLAVLYIRATWLMWVLGTHQVRWYPMSHILRLVYFIKNILLFFEIKI